MIGFASNICLRCYDVERRGLVTGVTNTVNGIIVSAYAYAHDRLGRVVSRNGDAFGYNPRSEVVSAAISTNAYSYSYDSIGNSLHSARNAETNLYAANALNQYASVTGAGAAQSLSYDADGNLLTWNGYSLVWDPDNRLYYGGGGTSDFGFFRDWSGRAFSEADVADYTDRLFDGWNPVFERVFDGWTGTPVSDTVYVWGTDLSGSMQGAGGVGGLLAVKRNGVWYAPLYDANGNVTAYVSESGAVVAEYEYDAFGNTIRQSGSLSDAFRHRFSTKPWIAALGAYDFGERMYSPELRRWLSRDPIGEDGGVNLFAFVKNSPLRYIDPIGLMDREEFGCCSDDRVIIELSKKLEEARNMSVTHPVGYRVLGRDPSGAWKLETMREFLEYGGFICCKDGKVSSTGPYPGTFRFDQQNGIPVEPVHSELPKWLANSTMGRWGVLGFTPTSSNVLHNKQAHCKGGAKNVVFYHYHPNSSSFSRGDIGVSKQIPIALYSEGKSYIEILIGGTGGQIIELGKGWAGDNERDL